MTAPHNDPLAHLPALVDEVRGLRGELGRQDRRGKWNRRLIYVLAVIVAAVLVLGLFAWRSASFAVCSSDRSAALSGPAADRVNLFFQAYTEAAGQIDHPLSDAERATVIGGLDKDRETFTVLPDHDKLVKATDYQILAYRDLVAALNANTVYNEELKHHPVCSFWSF